jgi:thiol-disulfide isomerase/thioredoxin
MKKINIVLAASSLMLGIGFTAVGQFYNTSPVAAAKMSKGALAPQLQGKPVVVDIYATWCGGCKNIAPTLSDLKTRYQDKATFVVFDVSDKKTTMESAAMAKKLGLTGFFNANKSATSTVAIIDPATGKILKKFVNNANASDYATVLDAYSSKMQMH